MCFFTIFSEALLILARRDCFFFSLLLTVIALLPSSNDLLICLSFFFLFHNRFSMCEPQRAIFLVHKPGHKWKELHERYSQWYFFSPLPTVFFSCCWALVLKPRQLLVSLSLSPLSNFNSKKKGRKKGPKRATKLPASVIEFFFISLYCFLFLFQQQV